MSRTLTPSESLIGETLQGRYRILEFVAEGGMGAVYRGERLGLERSVAIKFLRPILAADAQGRLRFEREAKTMSRLDHPNCVSVTDFGLAPDPYIVMEFVTGETVRDIFDRGPVDIDRSLYICQQILAGLAHAHDRQIVHRDIKPPNIMITAAQGTEGLVRILDFGLAKLHDSGNSDLSSPHVVVGTPSYMSPEQAGAGKADSRSDLYSVGVILFEAVTGEKPFEGDQVSETLQMHREAPVPRLATMAPDLEFPDGLQQIIDKAMAKKPEKRFATAAEFAEAVTELRTALKRSTPPGFGKLSSTDALAVTQATPRVDASSISQASIGSDPTVSLGGLDSESQAPEERPVPSPASRSRWPVLLGLLLLLSATGAFAYYDPLALRPDATRRASTSSAAASGAETQKVAAAPPTLMPPMILHSTDGGVGAEELVAGTDGGVPAAAGYADAGSQPHADAAWEDAIDEEDVDDGALDAEQADELGADDLEQELDELDDLDEPDTEKAIVIETSNAEPQQAALPPAPVRTVADARRLAASGNRAEAIVGLRQLRSKRPKDAHVRLLMGDLYFEQRWWSDGLAEYAAAIALRGSLRKRALINQNAIRALGSHKTRRKAQSLLIHKIGRSSLPHLRRAASKDSSAVIRKYAAALVKRISGSRSRPAKKSRRRR